MDIKVGIEKAKLIDEYTLWLEKDGKKRYIHSKYEPIKEAMRFADENKSTKKTSYVIFGAGLLYNIKELLDNISDNSIIIAIEPSKEVFELAQKQKEIYESVTNDSRLFLINFEDSENFYKIFLDLLKTLKIINIKFLILKYYDVYFPNMCKSVIEAVKNHSIFEEIEFNTVKRFAVEHLDNIISNVYFLRNQTFAMNLYKKFEGKSAIVVSAGPSLDKNIDLLKANEDKFIIISGGRTLKTLLDRGIRPHIVVSLDPSHKNFQLVENVLDSSVPMLVTLLSNKELAKQYKGDKIFLDNTGVTGLSTFFWGTHIDTISVSGTVATMQLNFADYLGCKKIALIGQDLAFTDNKFHSDSTVILDEEQNGGNDMSYKKSTFIEVKGNCEDKVYTDDIFLSFINDISNYVNYLKEESDVDVYNCTEAGAYINGTKVSTLQDFIDSCKDSEDYYTQIDDIIKNNKNKDSLKDIDKKMKELQSLCQKIINLSKDALHIVQRSIRTKLETENDRKNLKKIDKKLANLFIKMDISTIIAGDFMRMLDKVDIDSTKSDEERNQEVVKLLRVYYAAVQGIYKSLDYYIKLKMKDVHEYIEKEEKENDDVEEVK